MRWVRGLFIALCAPGLGCPGEAPHIEVELTHAAGLVEVELSGVSAVGALPPTRQALQDGGMSLLYVLPPERMVGVELELRLEGKKPDGAAGARWRQTFVVGSGQTRIQASLLAECGDGLILSEACDDQDAQSEDGCYECQVEPGWQCEGAPSVCTQRPDPPKPGCGDREIAADETCDDGNALSTDGCSALCEVELGFECLGEPSICTPQEGTVFVDSLGPACPFGAGTGSLADPYCSISNAASVEGDRVIIIAPGRYEEQVKVDELGTKVLSGMGLVTIASSRAPAIDIKNGAVARVQGLNVSGLDGTGGGIKVDGLTTVARLERLRVGPALAIGIAVRDSSVTVDRCQVLNNQGGGLRFETAKFARVASSIAAGNGVPDGEFGGIWLTATSTKVELFNNTVTDNTAKSDRVAGIRCDDEAEVYSSIVWNNHGALGSGVSEDCVPYYCDLDELPPNGLENFSADPGFLDELYHIPTTTSSACLDTGFSSELAPALDFEGDPRPLGAGIDVGADEAG